MLKVYSPTDHVLHWRLAKSGDHESPSTVTVDLAIQPSSQRRLWTTRRNRRVPSKTKRSSFNLRSDCRQYSFCSIEPLFRMIGCLNSKACESVPLPSREEWSSCTGSSTHGEFGRALLAPPSSPWDLSCAGAGHLQLCLRGSLEQRFRVVVAHEWAGSCCQRCC